MLDIAHLFAGSALAQTAGDTASTPGGSSSVMMSFLPLVLIFLVFYALIIRPQNKKIEAQEKMIKALKRGDRVVTAGGIYGKITKLEGDDVLVVEIADGVQVKVTRSSVSALVAKTEPAVIEEAGTKE
jgi:preprotein translocase subunit YajC